jgi:rhodanese-related sulfurtransferase
MTTSAIVVLAAGVMLAALVISRFLSTRSIPRVDPGSASERVRHGDAVLLDVRTGAERRGGTIQGAVHIPLRELSTRSEELKRFGSKEIICFCQSGSRSLTAASRLRRRGIKASSLDGGIGEWNFVHRTRR